MRARTLGLISALALGCAGVAAGYALLVRDAAGQRWDAELLYRGLDSAGAYPGLADAGRVWSIPLAAALAALLGVIALARRRWAELAFAASAAAVSAGATVALRSGLPRPYHGDFAYLYNTYPSAHVAAVLALGLAARALWPVRVRGWWRAVPVAALDVGVLALAAWAGWSSVATFAHRPSDVLGAPFVVVAGFAATALVRDAIRRALSGRAPADRAHRPAGR